MIVIIITMNILFDIGGTNFRYAQSSGSSLNHSHLMKTPGNYTEAINLFRDIAGLLGNKRAGSVVVGLPGLLNKTKDQLLSAPNLDNWAGRTIKSDLKQIFK